MFEQLRRKHRHRAIALFCLIGAIWLFAAFTPLVALIIRLKNEGGSVHLDEHNTFWLSTSFWIGVIGAPSSIIALRFAGRLLPSLTHARPAQTPEEQAVVETSDSLALATGRPSPQVLFIDTPGSNAAPVGSHKDRSILLVTTGVLQLPKPEREALLAICIARQQIGRVTSGHLLLAVLGPFLFFSWGIRRLFTSWKPWVLPPAVIISLLTCIGLITHAWSAVFFTGVIVLVIVLVLTLVFGIPTIAVWSALMLVTGLFAAAISKPAMMDADIGAVDITRYPPPLLDLLSHAADYDTSLPTRAFGIGPLWVLPPGATKEIVLAQRLEALRTWVREQPKNRQ